MNSFGHKPFFSIIIPTFNSDRFLKVVLESVFSQTYTDYEIIIVDGASTDNTLRYADSFNDRRISVVSEPDKGIYDAMNKGIALANGQWLYFLGSDDMLINKAVLADIYKEITMMKNASVVYGNVLIEGDTGWAKNGTIYAGQFSLNKLLITNICQQSIFYRREFLTKNNLAFNLKYPVCSDWDFNLQCWFLTEFIFIDKIVAVFKSGGTSTSITNVDPIYSDIKTKYRKYYKSANKLSLLGRLIRKGKNLLGAS